VTALDWTIWSSNPGRDKTFLCCPNPSGLLWGPTQPPVQWVKFSHYRPGVPQRVGRGIALFFHDRGTGRG